MTFWNNNNEIHFFSIDMNYFSSMISKVKLGKIIGLANGELNDIANAERFLNLIRE